LGLAGLVRDREVTPSELVEAAIARVQAVNPKVNAIVHQPYGLARRAAAAPLPKGPFSGVPFVVKDLLAMIDGTCTSNGCRFFAGLVAPGDSELVKRFRAAGLVIFARSNTSELGILPVTEPALHGPTRNPWDLQRTSGGSSGGSAAAVAAGIVPMAHGSDGGGSIRIPASCCGVFGLKPTRARNPLGPFVGEGWHGLAVEHALTRSVRDSAALLDATHGADPGAPYVAPPPERPFLEEVGRDPGTLRIALGTRSLLGKQVHADCAAAARDAAELCARLGHSIEEASPPIDRGAVTHAWLTIVAAETAAEIDSAAQVLGKEPRPADFEPGTWMLAQAGRKYRADEFAGAVRFIRQVGRDLARWFERYDLFLTPTLGSPPLAIGAVQPKPAEIAALAALRALPSGAAIRKILDRLADQGFEFAAFTPPANFTGQPAMSVPLFWNAQGLPIGVHFTARYGDEATLFRLAAQLERERPWDQRRPAIA
jgi:amidase